MVDPYMQYGGARRIQSNLFSVLSAVMGFVAALMIVTGILPIFFGSLAILFAILSRGRERRMDQMARIGTWISVIAITVGSALTAYTVYETVSDPVARERFIATYEAMRELIYGADGEGAADRDEVYRRYMELLQEYQSQGAGSAAGQEL